MNKTFETTAKFATVPPHSLGKYNIFEAPKVTYWHIKPTDVFDTYNTGMLASVQSF